MLNKFKSNKTPYFLIKNNRIKIKNKIEDRYHTFEQEQRGLYERGWKKYRERENDVIIF